MWRQHKLILEALSGPASRIKTLGGLWLSSLMGTLGAPGRWTVLMGAVVSSLQKFVSTTLRPTLMPYPELYNWDTCAQFVSDFLFMEPLPDPLKPVSPHFLSWDLRGEVQR